MLTFGDFLLVLIPVRLQISLSCYRPKNTVECDKFFTCSHSGWARLTQQQVPFIVSH